MIHISAAKLTRPATIAAICLVVAGISAASFIVMQHNRSQTEAVATTDAKKTAKHASSTNSGSGSGTKESNAVSGTSHTLAADEAAAADAKPAETVACKLLTAGIAKQVIGNGAHTSATSDDSSYKATDTSISSCAYANGSNTVQLVIRASSGQLGASENALAFGSAKPASTTTVQGYGQSAYWDPAKQTLNILGNNNWYVISRSTNTQADTEAVAKLLASGF